MEKPCYKDGCSNVGDFGTCDDCDRAGCLDHIVVTSKYEVPLMYLCYDCLDKRRQTEEQRAKRATGTFTILDPEPPRVTYRWNKEE